MLIAIFSLRHLFVHDIDHVEEQSSTISLARLTKQFASFLLVFFSFFPSSLSSSAKLSAILG